MGNKWVVIEFFAVYKLLILPFYFLIDFDHSTGWNQPTHPFFLLLPAHIPIFLFPQPNST